MVIKKRTLIVNFFSLVIWHPVHLESSLLNFLFQDHTYSSKAVHEKTINNYESSNITSLCLAVVALLTGVSAEKEAAQTFGYIGASTGYGYCYGHGVRVGVRVGAGIYGQGNGYGGDGAELRGPGYGYGRAWAGLRGPDHGYGGAGVGAGF
ncbi:uncharacterized protein PHALS_08057 [Plasmopara halstedii]|uniref:Uncharacterized protein n=1 Tax=Plasmopara halstedii TaxID=4781 RepID=A0A0P1B7Y3_PLAHL|nr:uncharacterized protein PHALS_08057 [Plasmopara halstedii]CEG50340.1 hypothetical protein PHALS_08057 [Plasmopara halstedii]|eukprot:XP_024586709.1 hypothetical protein PHALS_08057 [Plasmopara halstedii]